ncbi:WD40 repeat-like protein [Histomonas meleagridis]|uniref:WD40 repeat-like protein n=1 Tax=Histomonas meleagridis TaxID=135588 RepID=UPI00355AC84B|nr:WD40 repeat-like protein [Histomonas meleagridis]KAH0799446.1 WD40 repeat-like protein [Histomonas meleagridis]
MRRSDSPLLLAASYDLQIHVLDTLTGSYLRSFDISNSQANRIITDDNNFFVATYSYIFEYDINSNEGKQSFCSVAHESNVTDLCLSELNLFSCGEDKTIKIWDRKTIRSQKIVTGTEPLNTMVVLSDGNHVITGSELGNISLWDIRNSKEILKKSASNSPVRSISLSSNNEFFIASYMNGITLRYDIKDSEFTEYYKLQAFSDVQLRCAISPDCEYFATSGSNGMIKIYNAQNGDLRQNLVACETDEWVWDIAFTPDSSKLCSGDGEGFCRIWDYEAGRLISTFQQLPKTVSAIAIKGRKN